MKSWVARLVGFGVFLKFLKILETLPYTHNNFPNQNVEQLDGLSCSY